MTEMSHWTLIDSHGDQIPTTIKVISLAKHERVCRAARALLKWVEDFDATPEPWIVVALQDELPPEDSV